MARRGENLLEQRPGPRSASRFRERELRRAVRAARDAGAESVEVDPETGTIRVIIGKSEIPNSTNPWDEVLTDAADKKRPA
jgi:hypothetical protein